MHLHNECSRCGHDTMETDEYTCPDCGSEDIQEIYDMKCLICSWKGDQGSDDPCPKCGENCEEGY